MTSSRPEDLVQAEEAVEDGNDRRDERELRFEIAVPAAPVDAGIERKERPFVEVPGHRGGIELTPGVGVQERVADVIEAKRRTEREDQRERQAAAGRGARVAGLIGLGCGNQVRLAA